MKARPIALALAAAALALPSLAMAEIVYESTYYVPPTPDTIYYLQPTDTQVVRVEEPEIRYYYPAENTIEVNAQRASEDDLITNDVAANIASDPYIRGRVGVETFRRDVTLTGRVGTPGQKMRAENDARAVDDVGEIHNQLRSAVGDY
jgi:BON domain-containing protein